MRRLRSFVPLVLLAILTLLAWVGAAVLSGSAWSPWLDNLHWTVASLGGAYLAWASARRSEKNSAGWVLRWGTAWALGAYTIGQLVWNFETAVGPSTGLILGKSFYLALGPLMTFSLLRSWHAKPGTRRIPGIHLDATLMTLGILVFCLAFYLPHQVGASWLPLVVMLLYPVTLFGAFSLGLVLSLHDSGPIQPGRIVTLSVLAGLSVTWMLWNMRQLDSLATDGTVLNLSFSVFVLALGASVGTWSWSRRTGSHGWKSSVLVLLPLVGPVAGALGYVAAVTDPEMPDPFKPVFAVLAVILLVLSLVRQWMMFRALKEAQFHRERNTELEDALTQLRRTQDQLVQSAKLSALGQLIAGITHDLNSPLGAIRSSSSLLQTVLKAQSSESFQHFENLDADHRAVYRRFSEALSPELEFLDSRAERLLRRELAEQATAAGHDPDELASTLVETGLGGRADLVRGLFELKDPAAVLGALQTQAVTNRLASVILQATDRASKVVVSLHAFLHNGAEVEKTWVEVAESVRVVLPLFEHRMKQGLQLTTSFVGEALILAWPDKLAQVWVNLITNAVQAVGQNGKIEVAMRVEEKQAVVSILDDGPGVPAEARDRIFQAFFTTKAAGVGTGLGLEVCRRVVEELGGTISLESEPGRTVFQVRLPLAEGL